MILLQGAPLGVDPTNYLGRKWVYLSGRFDLEGARRAA